MKDGSVVMTGLDILDVLQRIIKEGKRYQAMTLSDLELELDVDGLNSDFSRDSESFKIIRKSILDNYNSYTREIIGIIFGDVDYSWH
jgi:hypothetical protein